MTREYDLSLMAKIENTDFFRAVTEAGASKKVTGELVKAFIGASTIAKVNDYYYFQDAANPEDNDYRIFANSVYLDMERYESGVWVQQFRIGGSIDVKGHVRILKESLGVVSIIDDGQSRNLVRTATFSKGTILADIFGTSYIGTSEDIIKFKPICAVDWNVVQGNDSAEHTGTSFSLLLTTGPADAYAMSRGKIKGVNLPAGVIVQAKAYLQSDLSTPVWQSISDEEFAEGHGIQLFIILSLYKHLNIFLSFSFYDNDYFK